MIVKNISGSTLNLVLGIRNGFTLANNAQRTVDDQPETVADAVRYANQGLLQIVTGPAQQELNQPAAVPGHIIVGIKVPVDTHTLTLGTTVFEFDSNSATTAGRTPITIGGNATVTAATLATAIGDDADLAALGVVVRDSVSVTANETRLILTVPADLDLADLTTAVSNGTQLSVTEVAATTPAALRMDINTSLVSAAEVTASNKLIVTGLSSISHFSLNMLDPDDVPITYDGSVVASGGSVLMTDVGNGTGLVANQTVVLTSYGY